MRFLVLTDIHRGFSKNTSSIQDKFFSSINQDSFDAVLCCGDWGTSKLEHVKGAFKAVRAAFQNKPIYGVLGNHDFWDKYFKIEVKEVKIKEYASKYNIHLLENNPYETDDFILFGFNGWYGRKDPKPIEEGKKPYIQTITKGIRTDFYFQYKANKAVDFIMNYPKKNKKIIVVSHFPFIKESMDKPEWCADPAIEEKLLPLSDIIIFGHTHWEQDYIKSNTRVINVGSGYQEVDFKINEVLKYKILEF